MDTSTLIDSARARHPEHAARPQPAAAQEPGRLMLLPASDPAHMRLLRVPEDFESHEAFRAVTGVIARVEEDDPDYEWDDIQSALEAHGFETVDFAFGPALE